MVGLVDGQGVVSGFGVVGSGEAGHWGPRKMTGIVGQRVLVRGWEW